MVFIIIELFLGKIGIVELMIGIWVVIIGFVVDKIGVLVGFIGIVVLIIRFIVEIEIWVDKRLGIVVSDDLDIGFIIHFSISWISESWQVLLYLFFIISTVSLLNFKLTFSFKYFHLLLNYPKSNYLNVCNF